MAGFENWTTITDYRLELYEVSDTTNYEFTLSTPFKNPAFMIFWNSIRYNGSITGVCPTITQVDTLRYRINPMIYITKQYKSAFNLSATQTPYTISIPPFTKRISLAGYLYPNNSMGSMNGVVKIEILNSGGGVIQTFNNVNVGSGGIKQSYWWFYLIPDNYYKQNLYLRYTLVQTRGTGCVDMFILVYDNDLIWQDNGGGSLTSYGYASDTVQSAKLTVLVVEKGERTV